MNCKGKLIALKHTLRWKHPNYVFELLDNNTLVGTHKNEPEKFIEIHTYETGGMFGGQRNFKMCVRDGTNNKIIKFDGIFRMIEHDPR